MSGKTMFVAVMAVIGVGLLVLIAGPGGAAIGVSDGQFASLVALGAWALVLSASLVFLVRARSGQMLRHAGIWILLFLAVIGLYAFADDFRGVGQRIQAALLPGTAVQTGGGQVTIHRGFDHHFRVPVEIDGVEVPMLVDTGASVLALDREEAATAGIDVSRLSYSATMRTANGITQAAPIRLASVRVGGIERRNVQAVVVEGDGIGIGLLGMSFLGQLSSVEFRGDRLVLND